MIMDESDYFAFDGSLMILEVIISLEFARGTFEFTVDATP